MSVEVNGIAHIQMTAIEPASVPFWEKLCHFLEMKTLIKADDMIYCIGSRTGILVRVDPEARGRGRFDQNRAGLHHLCFRARQREDVDAIARFVTEELGAQVVHPAEDGAWAPGYYSVLFEFPILGREFAGVLRCAASGMKVGGSKIHASSRCSGRTRIASTIGDRSRRQPAKSNWSSPRRSSRHCASTARSRAA